MGLNHVVNTYIIARFVELCIKYFTKYDVMALGFTGCLRGKDEYGTM